MKNNWIKVGAKCRWNDPAINDYSSENKKSAWTRIFTVVSVNGDIVTIDDGFTTAEAYAHELVEIPEDKIVAFHIGRGGRFHNSGYKSVMPHIKKLNDCFSENSIVISEDEDGKALPDEEWELIDGGSNVILKGRDKIENETGILDWDGEYDTDIVKYISECDENELRLLIQTYEKDGLDEDIITAVMYHWNNMLSVVDEEDNTIYLGMNRKRIFEEAEKKETEKVMTDDNTIIWEKHEGINKLKTILKFY